MIRFIQNCYNAQLSVKLWATASCMPHLSSRMLVQGSCQVRIGTPHHALPRVAPWRARLQVDGGLDEAGPAAFAGAAQLVSPEHQLQA